MSSKANERDQTKYQIGISSSNAETLRKQGNASGERRGKAYGSDAYKLPNAQEEENMRNAGIESSERRRHVTENIANQYRSSSG
ncbi:hypothetical protein BO86DRAFT_384949 [Aspergillus japonicus CBS 114.51]|uniref:Uncharacterized protein n=1 Tax=Aspergillus japonicus CBS 114.51 TaxID=1448312 RepID=A0A8T8XGC1_ASPJA|nr:hypothetical protein BO86DRAFT_384949 [Aspergillus japonicus CBS 114.51]RAH86968.1 hypothetical protein BO86DRAFT_384949 [Aspergillus japonicus CBS 114.51]